MLRGFAWIFLLVLSAILYSRDQRSFVVRMVALHVTRLIAIFENFEFLDRETQRGS